MEEYKVPMQEMMFSMNEVLNYKSHYSSLLGAEDATPDMVQAILLEAAKFSENTISPLNHIGDIEGCKFVDGVVTTPKGFKEAFHQYRDSGWVGLSHSVEHGGQGLPTSLGVVVQEMLVSANHAWSMYITLVNGAIATLKLHGSEKIKQKYLPPLVEGRWGASMCLTEAHCGSDLGLLNTKAVPNKDGTFSLTGSKIFISGGEQDLTENIIHLVLARLPNAPEGPKGISLFLVPKFNLNDDNSLAERNNVSCGSIEKKMGIHGNATCVINFDEAEGYLIGGENKGLNCMFSFINESRLSVAQQGHGASELSYQRASAYALERLQMRAPVRKLSHKPADPIIVHPDVRRMLLTQKVFAEGGRLLNYYCAQQLDLINSKALNQNITHEMMVKYKKQKSA